MLISLTVGKVDAGVAVLLTQDKRLIEFPSILLPPNISSGSIVDITVARNLNSEKKSQENFSALQDSIHSIFGISEPAVPILRCRNATQTSVVLEWDTIDPATADIISLSLYRNGQKAGNIPRPEVMQSTKISGLAIDTEYTFHLVLRTTAGTYNSERVTVKTHKMTDLSGITVTPGILPAQLRESLTKAVERIGAKMADTVRIDTTHFVSTEGHGSAWEKAVEMNVPVVRPEWIESCEAGGRIVGVRQYYLDADPKQRQMTLSEISSQSQLSAKDSPGFDSLASESIASPNSPPTPPVKDKKMYNGEKSERRNMDGGRDEDISKSQEKDQAQVSKRVTLSSSSSTSSSEDKKIENENGLTVYGNGAPETGSFQDVAL